jgi:hypothetical protein
MAKQTQQQAQGTTKVGDKKASSGKRKPALKRIVFPLVGNTDTKVYPFVATPAEFNFVTHKLLKKKDFATDAAFFTFKGDEMRNKATIFDGKAEEAKKMGSSKERAKAKRFLKMRDKMAELKASLEAQGIDVESMLEAVAK